jgi:hypothetical protein
MTESEKVLLLAKNARNGAPGDGDPAHGSAKISARYHSLECSRLLREPMEIPTSRKGREKWGTR